MFKNRKFIDVNYFKKTKVKTLKISKKKLSNNHFLIFKTKNKKKIKRPTLRNKIDLPHYMEFRIREYRIRPGHTPYSQTIYCNPLVIWLHGSSQ